ncbi:hypothetical protein ACFQKF_14425 [Halalkalicoccus sp. GCM10025322]
MTRNDLAGFGGQIREMTAGYRRFRRTKRTPLALFVDLSNRQP